MAVPVLLRPEFNFGAMVFSRDSAVSCFSAFLVLAKFLSGSLLFLNVQNICNIAESVISKVLCFGTVCN